MNDPRRTPIAPADNPYPRHLPALGDANGELRVSPSFVPSNLRKTPHGRGQGQSLVAATSNIAGTVCQQAPLPERSERPFFDRVLRATCYRTEALLFFPQVALRVHRMTTITCRSDRPWDNYKHARQENYH